MISPQALFRGLVSRILPQVNIDSSSSDVAQRFGRYGEGTVLSYVRKAHLLADEGSYFVFNNGVTAITGQTDAAFAATHPSIAIYNSDSPSNQSAKRVYLDYIYLLNGGTAFSNATSNTGTFVAVITDTQAASGGSLLTGVSPNQDLKPGSVSVVRVGALTAPAVSAASRTLVGQRLLRAPVSATALTLANLDQFFLNFGAVEGGMALPNAASATLEASMVGRVLQLPPVVLGPGQSAWIYVFSVAGGAVTAGNLIPEIGVFER